MHKSKLLAIFILKWEIPLIKILKHNVYNPTAALIKFSVAVVRFEVLFQNVMLSYKMLNTFLDIKINFLW